MARLIVGSRPFDMTAWDLSDIAAGTVTLDSATVVDIAGAGGHLTYRIAGSGFTTFDANGFPTDGTITSFGQDIPGKTPLVITGLSISATSFMGFVNTNDPNGLENAIFAGNDSFVGRAGDDVLLGFGGNDGFNLTKGGDDTAQGGAGNDLFQMGGALTAADSIDGGTGTDRMILGGDYSAGLTFAAATMTNIETLQLVRGHSYDLVLNDGNVAAGQVLAVKAATLAATDTLTFDGSAETNGGYGIIAGSGNDTLIGGAGNDVLEGENGDDTIDISHGGNDNAIGGAGNDTFLAGGAFTTHDRVNGGAGSDTLALDGNYAAAMTIAPGQIDGLETMTLGAGNDYNLTIGLNNGTDLALIDASALGAGNTLTLAIGGTNANHPITIRGGAGNDTIDTTSLIPAPTFDLSQGGDDTVSAADFSGAVLDFGAAFTAADTVIFAPASSQFSKGLVVLDGDYSAGVVMTNDTFQGVQALSLVGGHDYNLTFGFDIALSQDPHDPNQTSQLRVTDTLTAADHLTIDASALGTNLILSTGAGTFNIIGKGGIVAVPGSGAGSVSGAEKVEVGADFSSAISLTGDGGTVSEVDIVGPLTHTIDFTTNMMQNFGILQLPQSGKVVLVDGNITAGHTLLVKGIGITVDDSAETDGHLTAQIDGGHAIGGALNDQFIGATHADFFTGGGGGDLIDCGSSTDTIIYNGVSDSATTGDANFDSIVSFNTARDIIQLPTAPTAIDTAVTATANFATMQSDLEAAVGAAQLGVGHAIMVNITGGELLNQHFMIIDANGVAGYQAGQDYVIHFDSSLSGLSLANFT